VSAARARWVGPLGWLVLMTGCASAPVTAADRFVARLALADGFVCVVAEGDLEPRSIGTFSVRVYRNLDVGDFVAGVIARRNGFVKAAYPAPRDGRGAEQIAVEVETAGSGRHVETQTFVFDAGTRSLRVRRGTE